MPRIDAKPWPLNEKQNAEYDMILSVSFARLDCDDYEGFWEGIDAMNALVVLARG